MKRKKTQQKSGKQFDPNELDRETIAQNPNVLLVEPSTKEADMYSDVVREISEVKLDVMSRVGSSFDWLVPQNYQLIIIDTSVLQNAKGSSRMNALSLLERIKRASPETSVILLSNRANVEEAVAAIRMGAEDYLKKPFDIEQFKLSVKRALDRKFVFGGNLGAVEYLHLLNACQMISAALEQSRIFSIIRSYFSQELQSSFAAIYSVHDGEAIRADDDYSRSERSDRAMDEVLDIAVRAISPFDKMAEQGATWKFVDRGQLTPGLFVFRFHCAGESDYFCVALSPKKPESLDSFENRLHLLSRQIEVSGNNIRQYMGVQHLVYLDDVTGLYNTRYLHYTLEREIKRFESTKQNFAVLFIDIDHFKYVNDNYGHLVGTRILCEMGELIKECVREKDIVFRYGGDEFVSVLSPCDLETAKSVAERIRVAIENFVFVEDEDKPVRLTVSIGVAVFPVHARSKKGIIDMADRAMYSAKKISRNLVQIVPDDSEADTDQDSDELEASS